MTSAPHTVAVVGCGVVSDMHFRGYLAHPERIRIVAAVDPLEERRTHVSDAYGVKATYASVDELIHGAEFDTAVVCTPTHLRLGTVRALAAAGKHVLVEKPMADSLEDARAIVDLCVEAGVHLAVDQNFRDHYPFGIAREVVQAGHIGRVIGIDHRELVFREVQGWRAQAHHHSLAVMGVHWFDGFRYLLDSNAHWLVARNYVSPAMNAMGETDAFVQIHFGAATVNYTQSFSSRFERVETIVIGERGTLALDYESLRVALHDGTTQTRTDFAGGEQKPESAYRCLDRLLTAIDTGEEPGNSGADNLMTLSLLFGAYRSSELNAPIDLKEGLL